MDNQPLVSIIVPVYKVEKYLRTCLDSIIAQSYQNWEAILVDDGSPDNCPAIIDEYASREARMRTVHRENGGQSAARNSGLRTVQGAYVAFLDSDDFWHPDHLKNMMEVSLKEDADIVQCSFVRGKETVFPEISTSKSYNVYDNHSIFTSFAAKVIICCKIYKKYILEGLEFPEGRVNEDDCTNWRFYYRAQRIAVLNQPLYYYSVNPTSTMGRLAKLPDLRFIEAYKERIEFFENEKAPDLVAISRIQLLKSLSLLVGRKNIKGEDFSRANDERKKQLKALKESGYPIPCFLKAVFTMVDLSPKLLGRIINRIYAKRNS